MPPTIETTPTMGLIVIQRAEGDTWQWTIYDTRGTRIGFQDRAEDIAQAIEAILQWIAPWEADTRPARNSLQAPLAAKRRKRRNARK